MPDPLGGVLLLSIPFWLGGYFLHKNENSAYPRIKASRKVRSLFGDFRTSGTLSVLGVTMQTISYLLVLGGLTAEVTIPDPYARAVILFIWFWGLMLLGGFFRTTLSRSLKK